MALPLSFGLIGVFVGLAENLGTFFRVWRYPNPLGARARDSLDKWRAWSLRVIMTFTPVAIFNAH